MTNNFAYKKQYFLFKLVKYFINAFRPFEQVQILYTCNYLFLNEDFKIK